MILSAGFGTRLKPVTDMMPKALVVYKGKPLIQHQIERLRNAGVREIVINTHHLPYKIAEFINNHTFEVKINLIVEKEILGTGGAVLNAKDYFQSEDSFVVINVDIDTDADIKEIINFHSNDNLATIGVQKRKTTRYLEFTEDMNLIGRAKEITKENLFAFNGIHIISKEIFNFELEIKYRDILDIYSDLSLTGKTIKGYNFGNSFFKDIGKLENLI